MANSRDPQPDDFKTGKKPDPTEEVLRRFQEARLGEVQTATTDLGNGKAEPDSGRGKSGVDEVARKQIKQIETTVRELAKTAEQVEGLGKAVKLATSPQKKPGPLTRRAKAGIVLAAVCVLGIVGCGIFIKARLDRLEQQLNEFDNSRNISQKNFITREEWLRENKATAGRLSAFEEKLQALEQKRVPAGKNGLSSLQDRVKALENARDPRQLSEKIQQLENRVQTLEGK